MSKVEATAGESKAQATELKTGKTGEKKEAGKKSEKNTLGDKIKAFERASEAALPWDKPWCARLDGHGFSKFTRGFEKPADARITSAMTRVTQDLVSTFNAVLGYTQSDEITLVFPATDPESKQSTPMYGLRVQKLATLFAGFASARFNHYLCTSTYGESESEVRLKAKATGGEAFFDCRVFTVPTPEDAMLAVFWRHRYDCYRNGVAALAMCHFSHKQLDRKKTAEKIAMLEGKGIKLEAYPPSLYYGTFVKRELFEVRAQDPRTKAEVTVVRTRTRPVSYRWEGTHEERTAFTFRKYFSDEPVKLDASAAAAAAAAAAVGAADDDDDGAAAAAAAEEKGDAKSA